MSEREALKKLHRELEILTKLDIFPADGVYEENFMEYAFCCAFESILIDRLFQEYRIDFPALPVPKEISKGLDRLNFHELLWEFESLEFNDCFFSLENLGVNVVFLGVDLEDRESCILSLPRTLSDLVRKRWVRFGSEIIDVEMDMLLEIPRLTELISRSKEGKSCAEEEELLALCFKILPTESYTCDPVILLPEDTSSGYVHLFFFHSQDTPFSCACYLPRAVFFAIYALTVLCGINKVTAKGGIE